MAKKGKSKIKRVGPGVKVYTKGPRKGKYLRYNGPSITLVRRNGKPVKANASVKMSLKSLRRLVSAAKQGRAASVKVRAR